MIENGNWIFTTINDMPRYQKPPLPTWLTAFSAMIFGMDSLFGLRFPASIMGLISVLTTYSISLKLLQNKQLAFLAGLITLTSFYIILSGRDGQWDIFTHAFMLLGIYFFIKLLDEPRKPFFYTILVGLFFGFSFLSKGPVSFYVLLLPFLIAYAITFKFKNLKIVHVLVGLCITTLVSGSWSFYVYLYDRTAVQEISSLEAGRWLTYNVRPFYYYWNFFIQSGLWAIPSLIALLYPYLKNKVLDKKGYQFTFLWTILALILLSIIPEKKARYLLPVLFPMAINTAFYVEYIWRKFKIFKPKESFPVYVHFGLITLLCIAIPFVLLYYFGNYIFFFDYELVLVSLAFLLTGIYVFLKLINKQVKKATYATVFLILLIISFGLPLSNKVNQNSDYRGAEIIHQLQKKQNVLVYEFSEFIPELIWEYGKPIPVIKHLQEIYTPNESSFLVLVRNSEEELNEYKEYAKKFNSKVIDSIDINPVNKKKNRLQRLVFFVEK